MEQFNFGINDPSIYEEAFSAWPAGNGTHDPPNVKYSTPLNIYLLNDLAVGWYPSPFEDGFSLKLANLDGCIDLLSARENKIISALEPTSLAEIKIVQLTPYEFGYGYWKYRYPNSKILTLNPRESSSVLVALENYDYTYGHQMNHFPRPGISILSASPLISATALTHSVELNLTERADLYIAVDVVDMRLSLEQAVSTIKSGGAAAWRLNLNQVRIELIYFTLLWLQSVFNQIGLIQLVCSPPGEFWIWAKHRVSDKYFGTAIQKLHMQPKIKLTAAQIEYVQKFWNLMQTKEYIRADRAINQQARIKWFVY